MNSTRHRVATLRHSSTSRSLNGRDRGIETDAVPPLLRCRLALALTVHHARRCGLGRRRLERRPSSRREHAQISRSSSRRTPPRREVTQGDRRDGRLRRARARTLGKPCPPTRAERARTTGTSSTHEQKTEVTGLFKQARREELPQEPEQDARLRRHLSRREGAGREPREDPAPRRRTRRSRAIPPFRSTTSSWARANVQGRSTSSPKARA